MPVVPLPSPGGEVGTKFSRFRFAAISLDLRFRIVACAARGGSYCGFITSTAAMQSSFKPHPATSAFLLVSGAFMATVAGYTLFFQAASARAGEGNPVHVLMWVLLIAGGLLFLAGGMFVGRTFGFGRFTSLVLSLLPVAGLILMMVAGRRAPKAWTMDKTGPERLTAKRNHLPMKALY